MGYLCVWIALLAGATKGFMGKKISGTVTTVRQSVFVNLIRMLLCIIISIVGLALETSGVGSMPGMWITPDVPALIFGSMAGVMISMFTITWLLAIRHGAYMLISVAQMFGVVVTLVCSFVVFRETITFQQFFAIGLLIASVLIMGSYSSAMKGKLTLRAVILLVLCGLSCGLYDFSQKLFTFYSESGIAVLNLLTYTISVLLLCMTFFFMREKDHIDTKQLFKGNFLFIFIMSVCLFLNSYFKALATEYLTATQIYPVYQAGGLIASALMSAVFFKEKITPRCITGLLFAFLAILLLR